MITEAALLIMSAAVVVQAVLRERSFAKERQQWTQERHKLLDRIQATDLSEYKALEQPTTPRQQPQPTDDIVEI
jgi:hypothetical protein